LNRHPQNKKSKISFNIKSSIPSEEDIKEQQKESMDLSKSELPQETERKEGGTQTQPDQQQESQISSETTSPTSKTASSTSDNPSSASQNGEQINGSLVKEAKVE